MAGRAGESGLEAVVAEAAQRVQKAVAGKAEQVDLSGLPLGDEGLALVLGEAPLAALMASSVVSIDVSSTGLVSGAAVSRLTFATRVSVAHNRLRALADLGPLRFLNTLSASHNELEELPEALFTGHPHLVALDVAHNRLGSLPPSVSGSALQTLNASHNALEGLESLAGLEGLTGLDLSHNRLRALPSGFDALSALESLDLSHNALTALPPGVSQCPGLKAFSFDANPALASPPAEVVARGNKAVLAFLAKAYGDQQTGVVSGVLHSVTVPGVNPGLLKFVAVVYAGLILLHVVLFTTLEPNIHLFVILALSIGLAASLTWFVYELSKAEASAGEAEGKKAQ